MEVKRMDKIMNNKHFSIVTAFLLALSIISSTAPASATTIPDGQYLGFSTCCGEVITIINGGEHEVGESLYFQDFAWGPNFWLLNPGDSLQIIEIVNGGMVDSNEELVESLGEVLDEYGVSGSDNYVTYLMERVNAEGYTGGIFSFGPIDAPTSGLVYGNPNSYADPTGELRSLINQIKNFSGNLIGWK